MDTTDLVNELTQSRFEKVTERTARNAGYGATDAGMAIANRYLKETLDNVSEAMIAIKRTRVKPLKEVLKLDPRVIALGGISCCVGAGANADSLTKVIFGLGMHLESEVWAYNFKNWDSIKAENIRKACMRRGNIKNRKQAARSMAQRAGFLLEPWSGKDRLKVGKWLLEILLKGSAFVLEEIENTKDGVPGRRLAITEEAVSVAEHIITRLIDSRPALLPVFEKPKPWVSGETTICGYQRHLVRSYQRPVLKAVDDRARSGDMDGALKALNAIQEVPYRINEYILDVAQWAYDNEIPIDNVPPLQDLPFPERSKDWEDMDEDERRLWKTNVSAIRTRNRGFIGERWVFQNALETARYLKGRPFYVPCNMDYRGRVYGMSSFQYQRQDYIRAMFLFDEGKPIGSLGRYWLMVHLANCGDFDKISKKPFNERFQWVWDNKAKILSCATSPTRCLWWTKADKPFMFLAACKEFINCLDNPGYVCHLPVSFDGSCSGLQHLAAMTRDEVTAKEVNLVPTETPGDIYSTVSTLVNRRIEADLTSDTTSSLASLCLSHGVNRSLVKRNVMTYSYSSNRFGMANQHVEDTMNPLAHKVLAKELSKHPFETLRDDGTGDNGWKAARYLAGHVFSAIESVVTRPAAAMRFLQDLARTLAHENKPVVWHTPDGFPVVMRYMEDTSEKVFLWLQDKGVKVAHQTRTNEETKVIDKTRAANAIAPGFVHSLDAYHLRSTVNRAVSEGVTSVALVHDSFGCLPADAERFRPLINEQFYMLYRNHDVLLDIREEVLAQVDNKARVPQVPEYGSLDIAQVLKADYSFA
ncbi:MAG: hypothetical protein PHE17_19865 [Thiothrix sp.]|uniref:DNA-directed RNA polymerase n=1 Tax=Thiothrix sp. TaxID=1032 RepID=UPI002622186D|nr:DNA-directed RNA polymerase [Thiothrix sp.]MDD5395286.1 hypothetical protein [Thiothrix sp.]